VVRETRVLRRLLDRWEQEGLDGYGGRYCGYTTIEGVKSAIQNLRDSLSLPKLTTYSFRHKAGTIIRKARVSEDELAFQMGHKRKDLRTTAGYGEFSPDYLAHASRALDAWFLRIRRLANSQEIPKSISARTKTAA